MNLPEDILQKIFTYLEDDEVRWLLLTQKIWREKWFL